MTTLDRIPVSTLPGRYEIGRTALYARLKAAQISPEKGTISKDELNALDDLDNHLKAGGKLNEFTTPPNSTANNSVNSSVTALNDPANNSVNSLLNNPVNHSLNSSVENVFYPVNSSVDDTVNILEALAIALHTIDRLIAQPSPLAHLEALERAYEKQWLLSNQELAHILNIKPSSLSSRKVIQRGGFTLQKIARAQWQISKTSH